MTHVTFVIYKFPAPTEYFILNELHAICKTHSNTSIFVFKKGKSQRINRKAQELSNKITYARHHISFHLFPLFFLNFKRVRHLNMFIKCDGTKNRLGLYHRLKDIVTLNALNKHIQNRHTTHLHAHFLNYPSYITAFAAKINNIPFSCTGHAYDIFAEKIPEMVLKRSKNIITCTLHNKQYLMNTYQLPDNKIHVIYHGINMNEWGEEMKSEKEKDHVNGKLKVLSIGRLVKKKGHIFLLQALNQLKNKIDIELTIVGEGKESKQLYRYCKKHKLKTRVTIMPFMEQNKLVSFYKDADIFILPCTIGENNDRDGIPNVIMEAMALNCPVISSNISAIPEIITQRETGLLAKHNDVDSLKNAIIELFDNYGLQRKIVSKAYTMIKHHFNFNEGINQINRILFNDES